MATMIQGACPTKFVGDMEDLILTSADSVEFQLKQSGTLILKENYSPANGSIRIGGLDAVIDTCLFGELKEEGGQDHLSAQFQFLVDGEALLTSTLYASHQKNGHDPEGRRMILSHGISDECYPGVPHPLTFIGQGTAKLYSRAGQEINSRTVGSSAGAYTQNCDPEALFPTNFHEGERIVYTVGGDTHVSRIDRQGYPDATAFMFLNMYDAPEVVLAKSALQLKPQSKDDIGTTFGEDRKYSIEQTDEYTAESGSLGTRSAYSRWRDLMMSRKVSVLWEGRWLPIIVTKPNYQQTLRRSAFGSVNFTFRMARQRDYGVIEC